MFQVKIRQIFPFLRVPFSLENSKKNRYYAAEKHSVEGASAPNTSHSFQVASLHDLSSGNMRPDNTNIRQFQDKPAREQSLAKEVITILSAVGLSIKPGGVVGEFKVDGGIRTHGAGHSFPRTERHG
jgi:hypothetical protein